MKAFSWNTLWGALLYAGIVGVVYMDKSTIERTWSMDEE